MDEAEARARAQEKLRELQDPGTPLQLAERSREIEWAWLFAYNSVRYAETGSFVDLVISGPIVVNKDGSDVWVAGSAPPIEQFLNRYAEEHGYPSVPVPEVPKFGAPPAP